MPMIRALAAGLLLLLAACASTPSPEARKGDVFILVSIDGFRTDYLGRGLSPTLSALADGGVKAEEGMRPSFPSVTFPNHYTLVTGLRPDHHGIVNNTMQDPAFPGATFRLSDRVESTNARWWNAAEPIWVTAEKQGVRTATMFWPGTEVAIRGTRPQDWVPFDQSMPSQKRVDQVLAWLDRPAETRPRFVTLYFDIVDTKGHDTGPDSAETNAAIAEVDAAIGGLVAGLKARKLSADLLVVADHGMAQNSAETTIQLDDIVAPELIDVPWFGPYSMGIAPKEGQTTPVEAALLGRHGHLECWRKGEMPARFHFGTHPRIPPIFCLPDTGWTIVSKGRPSNWKPQGSHGYDNDAPEMRALFIANGPAFRSGVTLPVFDNVDIYPLMTQVLGIRGEPSDGALTVTGRALK